MIQLLLASLLFVFIHVWVAGTKLREVFIRLLGRKLYILLFALLSSGSLLWMITAVHQAPYVELWGQVAGNRWLAVMMVFIATLFIIYGLLSSKPQSVGHTTLIDSRPGVHGIYRICRYPFLTGLVIWTLVHITYNGDLAALLFFGAILMVCLFGIRSMERKMREILGAQWETYVAHTSVVPFVALLQGRNHLRFGEFKGWPLLLGLLLFGLLLNYHQRLFGVPAW